ncbi:6-phosphogluconolactonase [Nocardioides limicola]|uniref:6-phosphogluconolactonase n=1 Tax=Nocardioides limicola TaxID=2803368 RepID=UPI00193BE1C9|nr:6-phosphogluconolactonase [Nocardioides sp. DJM-14]
MTDDVRVLDSPSEVAEAVSTALIARLAAVQSSGRTPSVVLTGGTVASLVHRAVAASVDGLDVDWHDVDFWFGDERYVDSWSEDRNAGQARRDLLDHVDADPRRVHEMPAADSGLTLDEASAAYADEIRAHAPDGFDLVMLGVGPDGHVASLFPGFPQLVADGETVPVTDSPKPPPERISLTFAALNRTPAVWFLVTGAAKAAAVAAARASGADIGEVPAAGVRAAETIWWLDSEAATDH